VVPPGGRELAGLLGSREGLRLLTGLLTNREAMEKIIPLLQRIGGGVPPGSQAQPENGREDSGSKKNPGREVIRWDFGRSEGRR